MIDECPTKCINLVSGHSAAPDHKSSLLKISRLNPATQRSAGCSIIRTFNYLQIENGKNRKWGGFAINSFLFCPENVYLSWPRYLGGGQKQNQNENSFLSARKLHQIYMKRTKMYYHVWRQLQLIIHFGLPSPPHDNVVHSVPLSLGSHPFSHFHTLDYHKLTTTKIMLV